MSIDMRYVYVNIYNKGVIPFIMKTGPIFNMGMRYRFYEQLKSIQGIIIYTVEEDASLRARGIIPGRETGATPKSATQQTASAQSVNKTASVEGQRTMAKTSIDEEIDKRAGQLPEFDDENIQLSTSDMEEIKEHTTSRVYTREELQGMSKIKLKHILNVERKNLPGSKYYGAFHDRKPKLIDYVLASQDSI
jgi:hypothetical protein